MPMNGGAGANSRHSPGRGIVAEGMRPKAFRESRSARALAAGMPHGLVRDRPLLLACRFEPCGEQVDSRLHSANAPIVPQLCEQLRRQWEFPVARVLALVDVDDHALAVDVANFQLRCLGSPEAGGV